MQTSLQRIQSHNRTRPKSASNHNDVEMVVDLLSWSFAFSEFRQRLIKAARELQ